MCSPNYPITMHTANIFLHTVNIFTASRMYYFKYCVHYHWHVGTNYTLLHIRSFLSSGTEQFYSVTCRMQPEYITTKSYES